MADPSQESADAAPLTMFEKIWRRHAIFERDDGQTLLFVDRHYMHEGSFHAFDALERSGRKVRRPELTFGVADHYVPTVNRDSPIPDPEIRNMVELFARNTRHHGIVQFDLADPRQGIVHVVGPELGLTLPGQVIVCGDSHTSTHGAFGSIAFGIGASEASHVLATQSIWQRRPLTMRVHMSGSVQRGVSPKDIVLALIGRIGARGAVGHAIEYAGPVVEALSMAGRMTICNMAIEAGAKAALIAPDETTLNYVAGRPFAPRGPDWQSAWGDWLQLASDPGAAFDVEVALDVTTVAPMVTWGTSPEDVLPIDGCVPDPDSFPDEAARLRETLDYMGLQPGTPLTEVAVDRVFIGSCTNGRMEDLREAAAVLRGRKARVPGIVVPGSSEVRRMAEAEGLHRVFIDAGLEWRESGCSMCVGINGDLVAAAERCASTTNRNFRGRQGRGARTHLMGPAMAAAAAVTGRLADVRNLPEDSAA